MAPEYDPDTDSDLSSDEGEETGVYLGLPDGALEGDDEANPLVSRAGGRPAFLPRPTGSSSASTSQWPPRPQDVSTCRICGRAMELLVQIFAPLEGSCYDRNLYVWGCARAKCQRARDNRCLRAFRTVTYNARWAAKLEKQKAKEAARQERLAAKAAAKAKAAEEAKKAQSINPFSSGSASAAGGMFGANPFAEAPSSDSADAADEPADDSESDSEDDEEFRLAEELAIKASLAEQESKASTAAASEEADPWKAGHAYYKTPQYVNTIPEPPSSSAEGSGKKSKKANGNGASSADDLIGAVGPDGKPFAKEGYEKMFLSGIDSVFERFVERVGRSPSQLIRYDFGGEPLPFSEKGDAFKRFWKSAAGASAQQAQRSFDRAAAGDCPVCGAKRVFEVQLMPNVVNMLRPEAIEGDSDDDVKPSAALAGDEQARRKREIEAALARPVGDPTVQQDLAATGIHRSTDHPAPVSGDADASALAKTGLAWSTALVFVCEKDCVGPKGSDALLHCAEELVEVMWEHD